MAGEINGDLKIILHRISKLEKSQEEGFERVEKKIDAINDNLHTIDKLSNENRTRIDEACKDIDSLEKKSNQLDTLTGIGAVIAAILGALGIARS